MKPPGQKIVADHEVVATEHPAAGHCIIHVKAPGPFPEILPGNFAEILLYNSPKTFLRRPFSVFDVNEEQQTLSFYIKIIGEGTRKLSEHKKGDILNLIYPLGNSFSFPAPGSKVLMVGGGSGIAPFLLLGKLLRELGIESSFLFGARSASDIVLTEMFEPFGKVLVTTEDGMRGHHGIVTGHPALKDNISDFDMIYTCGPEPMMKAVAALSAAAGIPCEASLENTMACGFGVCLSCVTETVEGNKCVCTSGPVFNTKQLKWQT
ncbi:MAG: dihydroorotate dehydrogenase electron transfer subunit [Bacteroidales bacterium]|nr:dihydroorotate dehydrogenase electron transfer subunit [Bacteroidales bacterium]